MSEYVVQVCTACLEQLATVSPSILFASIASTVIGVVVLVSAVLGGFQENELAN